MGTIGGGLRNLRERTHSDLYKILQDSTAFREKVLSLFKEKD